MLSKLEIDKIFKEIKVILGKIELDVTNIDIELNIKAKNFCKAKKKADRVLVEVSMESMMCSEKELIEEVCKEIISYCIQNKERYTYGEKLKEQGYEVDFPIPKAKRVSQKRNVKKEKETEEVIEKITVTEYLESIGYDENEAEIFGQDEYRKGDYIFLCRIYDSVYWNRVEILEVKVLKVSADGKIIYAIDQKSGKCEVIDYKNRPYMFKFLHEAESLAERIKFENKLCYKEE